jgi:hypothetical protein
MRVTLLGVLGLLGLVALLVYSGYELRRVNQEKSDAIAKES